MAGIMGRAGSLELRPPAVPPPIRQSVSEGRVPTLFYVESLNVELTETVSAHEQHLSGTKASTNIFTRIPEKVVCVYNDRLKTAISLFYPAVHALLVAGRAYVLLGEIMFMCDVGRE